jgi:hypothetical protein
VRIFGVHVLGFLDWLVALLERLITLSIGVAVFIVGWRLVWGKSAADVLTTVNQNWKALLIILIPLLYQTIRKFLDELEEFYGMKRKKKDQSLIESGGTR